MFEFTVSDCWVSGLRSRWKGIPDHDMPGFASSLIITARVRADHSSPVPPLPSFVFTLAATGTTLSISIFSSAEYSVWRAV